MTYISHVFKCLTLIALAIVLAMSLKPSVSIGGLPNLDKLLHFGAYTILATGARLGWLKIWGGFIFLALGSFGVAIEIAQHMMDVGRTGSVPDVIANLLGTALPLIIFHLVWSRHRR